MINLTPAFILLLAALLVWLWIKRRAHARAWYRLAAGGLFLLVILEGLVFGGVFGNMIR